MRTWTSSDGKEIEARLLGIKGSKAVLKLDNGQSAEVPLNRLAKTDQDYIKTHGWTLPKAWRGWPNNLQVTLAEIRIDELGKKESWFTYHSEHFEVAAEAELGPACVKEICRLLEGVYLLMDKSPWGVLAAPKGGKFRIELYQTRNSYIKNGGPTDSAGVYLTERAVFMVPFESLGIEESSAGWRQGREGSSKTLVHELTHMLMADALPYLPPWLVEGAAEYMELIPMRTSTFRPDSLDKELKKHNDFMIEKIIGGSPGPLSQVFDLNLNEWQSGGRSRTPPESSGRDRMVGSHSVTGFYHAGLLLTYYFIHLDGEGDAARLQRFIAAAIANEKLLLQYDKDYEAYEKAWEDFADRPEVIEVSEGQYRFPENLTPPEEPPYPFGDYLEEEVRFAELDVLLEGRDKETLLKKIVTDMRQRELKLSY